MRWGRGRKKREDGIGYAFMLGESGTVGARVETVALSICSLLVVSSNLLSAFPPRGRMHDRRISQPRTHFFPLGCSENSSDRRLGCFVSFCNLFQQAASPRLRERRASGTMPQR